MWGWSEEYSDPLKSHSGLPCALRSPPGLLIVYSTEDSLAHERKICAPILGEESARLGGSDSRGGLV